MKKKRKKIGSEVGAEIESEIKVNNINLTENAKSSVKMLKGIIPATSKKVSLQDIKDAIEKEGSKI